MTRRKSDSPQKAAFREMMSNYFKENDVHIRDGTDVNSIMRDMISVILEGTLDAEMNVAFVENGQIMDFLLVREQIVNRVKSLCSFADFCDNEETGYILITKYLFPSFFTFLRDGIF